MPYTIILNPERIILKLSISTLKSSRCETSVGGPFGSHSLDILAASLVCGLIALWVGCSHQCSNYFNGGRL